MGNYILFLTLIIFNINLFLSQDVRTLKGHEGDIYAVQFFPDGKSFASGGSDDKIFIWDYETLNKSTLPESDLSDILELRIVDNGRKIITANKTPSFVSVDKKGNRTYPQGEQTVGVWDVYTKTESYPINLFARLASLTNSSDGKFIYYAYENGHKSYWGKTAEINTQLTIWKYDVTNGELTHQDLDNKTEKYEITPSGKEQDYDFAVDLSVKMIDNNTISVLGYWKDIRIVNLSNNKVTHRLSVTKNEFFPTCLDVSPDNKYLAAANYSKDSYIYIWDISSERFIKTLKGHDKDVLCVSFSPDGNYLASGSKDNSIRLWDLKTGKTIKVLKGHEDNVNAVCFSPDGKSLVSGSDDETIKVWNIIDLLPELKTYSLSYEINIGIRKRIDEEYKIEFEETVAEYFKPKGEFEVSDEYNKRISTGNELQQQLQEKYKLKMEELKDSRKSELETISEQTKNEKQSKIESSVKDTTVNISYLSSYNADKQKYTATIKGYNVELNVPLSEAPTFKDNWKKAVVRCKKKLMDDLTSWLYYDFVVIHPVTKSEYIIGEQKQ